MSEPLRFEPEQLLKESSWVRSLARGLLTDRAAADDIVQDTWLAALEQPPKHGKLRAWLAAVVFNSVREHLRSCKRREARERTCARGEQLPSTDEIVQHEAERRRVVAIVLQLAEPYRSTLLFRYWCDLSPQDIAERLGVPASTVRNRLKRALQLLRERLDREPGGTERTVRALLALPIASVTGSSTATILGVLAMSGKLKLAIVCAIIAASGGITWKIVTSREGEATMPARSTASTDSPARGPALANDDRSPATPEPIRSAPIATPAPATSILLTGKTVDANGKAIAATVRLTSDGGEERTVRDDGHGFAVTEVAPGAWRATCRAPGYRKAVKTLELAHERESVEFVLQPALVLGVKFVTPEGTSLAQTSEFTSGPFRGLLLHSLSAIATAEPPSARVWDLDWNVRRSGIGEYHDARESSNLAPGCDGSLEVQADLPFYLSALIGDAVLDTQRMELARNQVTFVVSPGQLTDHAATLRMRVLESESGNVVTGVRLGLACGGGVTTTRADASTDGSIVLAGLPPGLLPFSLYAEGRSYVVQNVRLAAGEVLDLGTIAMPRPVAIKGRILGPDGAPSTSMNQLVLRAVDSLRPDEPFRLPFESLKVDAHGEFTASGVAPARYCLVASAADMGPVAMLVDASSGEVEDVQVELQPASRVTIEHALASGSSLRIVNADGLPLWFARVYDAEPLRPRLSPGACRLEAYREGALVLSQAFEVDDEPLVVHAGP